MGVFGPGSVVSSFGSPGGDPFGIEAGGDGCLWHVDADSDRVFRLDTTGATTASFTALESAATTTTFDTPNSQDTYTVGNTDATVRITARGGVGGRGGDGVDEQDDPGGPGGSGGRIVAEIDSLSAGDTLTIYVGEDGVNGDDWDEHGSDPLGEGPPADGGPGGDSPLANGGDGGDADENSSGNAGGGGGGGAASGVERDSDGALLAVAEGGGGGGGAGDTSISFESGGSGGGGGRGGVGGTSQDSAGGGDIIYVGDPGEDGEGTGNGGDGGEGRIGTGEDGEDGGTDDHADVSVQSTGTSNSGPVVVIDELDADPVPTGLGVDMSQCIWVADAADDSLTRYDQTGTQESSFASPSGQPTGVTVDGAGCLWHTDEASDTVYKLDQGGAIQSSFPAAEAQPQGLGIDGDGSLWSAGDATDTLYHEDQTGSTVATLSTPASDPRGLGLDGGGLLWHSDQNGSIYGISPDTRAISPATAPSAVGSGAVAPASTTATATATAASAGAQATGAQSDLSLLVVGTAPTASASPTAATGAVHVDAAASKPTASPSPRVVSGYATQPLLDGVPLTGVYEQILRWSELELGIAAPLAERDATIQAIADATGKEAFSELSTGGFETQDVTATDAGTFRYTPRYAESGFLPAQDVIALRYAEEPRSVDHDEFDVTAVFKLSSHPEPTEGVLSESGAGSEDWVFEFYSGTLVTPRVRRNTTGEASGNVVGYLLTLTLDQDEAAGVRQTIGLQGAVTATGGEEQPPDAIDAAPDNQNSVTVTPRDTAQIDAGLYVVRQVEFTRLDRQATWYEVEMEIVPNRNPIAVASKPTATGTPAQSSGGESTTPP